MVMHNQLFFGMTRTLCVSGVNNDKIEILVQKSQVNMDIFNKDKRSEYDKKPPFHKKNRGLGFISYSSGANKLKIYHR